MTAINLITGVSIVITLIVLIYLGIRYLEGDLSYKDEIYSARRYKRTRERSFGTVEDYIGIIVIKRTFESGRIKFITREVKS